MDSCYIKCKKIANINRNTTFEKKCVVKVDLKVTGSKLAKPGRWNFYFLYIHVWVLKSPFAIRSYKLNYQISM